MEHGGNIDGMTALVAMMPEEKTGLVILTNLEGTALTYALKYRVFDACLKQPPKDWSNLLLKATHELDAQGKQEEKNEKTQRVKGTAPSLALARHEGNYADSMYGEATVRLDQGALVLQYGSIVADLAHWQYDTFHATWRLLRLGEGRHLCPGCRGHGRRDEDAWLGRFPAEARGGRHHPLIPQSRWAGVRYTAPRRVTRCTDHGAAVRAW